MPRLSPHQQIVYGHLNKWRNLRAWGKSLEHVDLLVSEREYPKRAGTCWPLLQKVNVYHQQGLRGVVGMLKTGLHEFAHCIAHNDGHGNVWQRTYSKAVSEVTGEYVGYNFANPQVLDENCYRVMLRWFRVSGAEDAARRVLRIP